MYKRQIRTWGGEPSHTLCWCRVDGGSGDNCAHHGLGPEYAGARPDGTPCDPGCECCRADGGCGECAGDHVCEFAGDYGYCTSCELKFVGDDGLIEYCRNEAGDGFELAGTHYDNTCIFGHDDGDEDHCTPGWHSVKCLDDGTVMRGEGCTSCGDCAMYDYTAATGGRATCKLHGPDGSYSYSYSHSYSYSYCLLYTSPSPRD